MENQVTIIKGLGTKIVEQYKIPKTDAEHILSSFVEVVERLNHADLELISFGEPKELTSEVCKKAKELRMLFVKTRTRGDEIHKEVKAQILLRSKAIDGVRNIFKLQAMEREEKLKEIETHFERMEQLAIAKRQKERAAQLLEFGVTETEHFGLGLMTDEIWDNFYIGQKLVYEAKQKAIKKEKEDEEERKRLRIEKEKKIIEDNKKLKAKQKEIQKQLDKEREEAHAREAEIQRTLEQERINTQKQLDKEREEKDKLEEIIKMNLKKEALIKEENRKRLERENAEKISKQYLDFLNKNNVKEESLGDGTFLIERNKDSVYLYKLIDQLEII